MQASLNTHGRERRKDRENIDKIERIVTHVGHYQSYGETYRDADKQLKELDDLSERLKRGDYADQ